jgi:hypothetical protein
MSDGCELVDNLARLSLFADLSRPELEKLAHTVAAWLSTVELYLVGLTTADDQIDPRPTRT